MPVERGGVVGVIAFQEARVPQVEISAADVGRDVFFEAEGVAAGDLGVVLLRGFQVDARPGEGGQFDGVEGFVCAGDLHHCAGGFPVFVFDVVGLLRGGLSWGVWWEICLGGEG